MMQAAQMDYHRSSTLDDELDELRKHTILARSFAFTPAGLEGLLDKTPSMAKPSKTYQTNYELLAEVVDTYEETPVGQHLRQRLGKPKFHSYELRKFDGDQKNTFAAYEPGTGTLIFNEEMKDLLLSYIADPTNSELSAVIEEAITHEAIHSLGDHDEASTYKKTGELLKDVATRTGQSKYMPAAKESLTIGEYLSNASNPEEAYSKLLSGEVGAKELGLEGKLPYAIGDNARSSAYSTAPSNPRSANYASCSSSSSYAGSKAV